MRKRDIPGGGFDPAAAALNLSTLELEGEIVGGKGLIRLEIGTHAAETIQAGDPMTATARMGVAKARETAAEMLRICDVLEEMEDEQEGH